jgi:outer membrane protein insertion porin family
MVKPTHSAVSRYFRVVLVAMLLLQIAVGQAQLADSTDAQIDRMLDEESLTLQTKDLGDPVNLFRVDQIQLEGIKKVEREAVLQKISSQKGRVLTNYALRSDLKAIYALKYFELVEAHHKQESGENILLFKVKEKPIIAKIFIQGNSEIDDDDLKALLKVKEFSILDINSIKVDVRAMGKHYEEKGFYLASINYDIKKVDPENIELYFKVQEFDKVRVKKILFLGNDAFSDQQLQSIMETKEEDLFSAMNGSGNFKEFSFQTDIERIKYFYKTKGYLQVNVGSPNITVSEDKRWVFITVRVNEGPQFSVNDIYFQGEVLFTQSELMEKISLQKNATYSEDDLRKDIQLLTEMYQDEGYAFANVLRTLSVLPGENKVDVEFSFEKGKKASFGKITVVGNTKTRDKVIRRELLIKEGRKFSGTELRKSKESVNRLGFFEPGSVIFNTISPPGRDDVLDVEIIVKERNTGQITVGAGYSSESGKFLQLSLAQNNFMGKGQTANITFNYSNLETNLNIGFTEPYLFDTQWTAGGDIFLSKVSRSGFSYDTEGFDLRVGHPIFDLTRVFVTYKFADITITHTDNPTIIPAEENGISSSIQSTVRYDSRNNRMEPSDGKFIQVGVEYSGLGGDKKWFKAEFDSRYYHRVIGDLVFRSRFSVAKLSHVDSHPIPKTEKFALGGSRNLRGYPYEGVGVFQTLPVTQYAGTAQEQVVDRPFNMGGLFKILGTVELTHPLAREAGLKWVLFADAGNVYQNYMGENGDYDIRADYGFGFRWFSPIGIMRFEWGEPIGNRGKKSGGQFHFDIGQFF